VVLAVPSLINRAHILDLTEDRSLLRALAAAGTRPLLVDWGAPGDLERGFSLTDYIAGRLEQALDRVLAEVGGPVVLLGYCMGGLLTVALALRRWRDLSGLVCLATPWDFHAERPSQAKLLGASLGLIEPLLRNMGELPVDAIHGALCRPRPAAGGPQVRRLRRARSGLAARPAVRRRRGLAERRRALWRHR